MQVLRDPDLGDQAPVLAAVGPMQLEVASWRLEHEFGAAGRAVADARTRSPAAPTRRRRPRCGACPACGCWPGPTARCYALFESPYWLARVEAENPELTLDRLVAEGTAG